MANGFINNRVISRTMSGTTSNNGVLRTWIQKPIISASTKISGAYVDIIYNGTDWSVVVQNYWTKQPVSDTDVEIDLVILNE